MRCVDGAARTAPVSNLTLLAMQSVRFCPLFEEIP